MLRIGIIGYGYWGPNIVRNFIGIEGARIELISDNDPNALLRVQKTYPCLRTTIHCNEVLLSPEIDVVAIITPMATHYELAKIALNNGKHVFVEKPFTSTVDQAEELIELAEKKNLQIMVDYTFLFTGAVRKIKELIDGDVLGKLYYFDSTRINLGLLQRDANVVWDLAPHDLSIMDYLISEKPVGISAAGMNHINGQEDIAYITIYFSDKLIAHININWLSPVKIRTTMIGGQKKMLVWNDLAVDEKIKVYDRGIEINDEETANINYRLGDIWVPRIEQGEALKAEAEYFVDCINTGTTPVNDGLAGLRVVRMLEATVKSLKKNGEVVFLS